MQRIIPKIIGFGLNLWSLLAPRQAAQMAASVFSTPSRPKLRPKERAFLDTARQLRRNVAGQNIVEYHWGPEKGPLVLLSYGWAYNAGRWRHFAPGLVSAGYRVLAVDPQGHGLAGAGTLKMPDNAGIIRELGED